MKLKDLSPELQKKAKACKTAEELKILAQENGFELSDEELEGVSGGAPVPVLCVAQKQSTHQEGLVSHMFLCNIDNTSVEDM